MCTHREGGNQKRQNSKTCLKRPLKNSLNKGLKTNSALMQVKSIAECFLGTFCNSFDLHQAINGLGNQFWSPFERPLKKGFTVLSRNVDQKSIETVFLIAICRPTGDKWQSKTRFLSIFDPRLTIVDYVSIAAYPVWCI